MMIDLRNKESNELVSFDILDMDMSLRIEKRGEFYAVSINEDYVFDCVFSTEAEALECLKTISICRQVLERGAKEN